MERYERILFPTDGSEGARQAREHAISLVEATGGTLHVLSVVDTSSLTGIPDAERRQVRDMLETVGTEAVDDVARIATDRGIDVVRELREGAADRSILEYASEADIDLIVMGTRGRSGLDRLLLGSVTERVLERAGPPVLVISAEE